MIYYHSQQYLRILFQKRGSYIKLWVAWRSCLAAVSACIAVIAAERGVNFSNGFVKIITETGLLLTLLLAFRVTSAFTLWDTGVRSCGALSDGARCIMGQLLSYTTIENPADMKATMDRTHRYLVLFLSLIYKHVQGDDCLFDLAELELITEGEHIKLAECHKHQAFEERRTRYSSQELTETSSKTRPFIVLTWIRMISADLTRSGDLDVRFAQDIDYQVNRLSENLQTILKVAFTPIPFSYAQLLKHMIFLYTSIAPWSYADDLRWVAPFVAFLVAMIFYGCEEIAIEVEGPFGLDENDIDLLSRSRQLDAALSEMIDTVLHNDIPRSKSSDYWRKHTRHEVTSLEPLLP